jgi:hypothetical protein
VGRTFPLAFTSSNILIGFAASGISPLNEDIFPYDDILSSYVSVRPEPATVAQKESSTSELHTASQSLLNGTFIKPQFHQI